MKLLPVLLRVTTWLAVCLTRFIVPASKAETDPRLTMASPLTVSVPLPVTELAALLSEREATLALKVARSRTAPPDTVSAPPPMALDAPSARVPAPTFVGPL